MSTHTAIYTVAPGAKLESRQVPTPGPAADEVLIRVQYAASTPLDLHVADGWLLTTAPRPMGSDLAGEVLAVGSSVSRLKPGDQVIGYGVGAGGAQSAHQTRVVLPTWKVGKLPSNLSLQRAVTVPANAVTIFQAAVNDLGLELPYPKADDFVPKHADAPLLVWGGSGSVGQYAIQILRHWGYKKIIATASAKHHAHIKTLGASQVFDYREADVIEQILGAAHGRVPFILDAVGHGTGSALPISKIAQRGDKVAIVLPVILKDATITERPEYEMEVGKAGAWADGVEVRGIRAHHYANNPMFKEKLQPEIIPALLEKGVLKPNAIRLIEGGTLLERAQAALDILRRKEQGAEKLVWRVSEEL